MINKIYKIILVLVLCFSGAVSAFAQETVELSGDSLEYSVNGNIATAKGNVVIKYRGATLTCDEAEMDRNTKIAKAKGKVRLNSGLSDIYGENITFNFETMTGVFLNADIVANPYYGRAKMITKIGADHIVMEDGYMTTSDYDKPGYRLRSSKIDVYPGKKMVAHDIRPQFGSVPVMYVPQFAKSLTERRSTVVITPGYKKLWGGFLLTRIRMPLNDYLQATLHLNEYERKGQAEGFDLNYKTNGFGYGLIRGYYMDEHAIAAKRAWDEKLLPTIRQERYRLAWRHTWKIDDKTNALWQYYKISDSNYLKDYFQREYDNDSSPASYFVLTRSLPLGVMTLRADGHVNPWMTDVTRLPEIKYDLANQKLGDTNFYFKNSSTYSNLAIDHAAPASTREKTQRLDQDNELSYLTKIGIFEVKPYVGGEWTYYSRTKDESDNGSIRGIFRTGTSFSTKFYKIYNAKMDKFGIKIDQLRHIITPTIAYDYWHRPSLDSSLLDQYDAIDNRQAVHKINFGVEQKLQTKRSGKATDLARFLIDTDYRLKEDALGEGFDGVNWDSDFKPCDWLTFYNDGRYDTRNGRLSTANFDAYINGRDNKWKLGIGRRYNREVDDLITADFEYRVNRKWGIAVYERFDAQNGKMKEQEYRLIRDLHSWEMNTVLNHQIDGGNSIMFVFKLKAFPSIGFDFESGLSRRRPGTNQ
ncbi:MAG: LPS assembly protein LptD [Candidatus Omnitrophica bacterium]|nr:LPS assembly protein LptD [Candidatus Omnitrophota bacterium]